MVLSCKLSDPFNSDLKSLLLTLPLVLYRESTYTCFVLKNLIHIRLLYNNITYNFEYEYIIWVSLTKLS